MPAGVAALALLHRYLGSKDELKLIRTHELYVSSEGAKAGVKFEILITTFQILSDSEQAKAIRDMAPWNLFVMDEGAKKDKYHLDQKMHDKMVQAGVFNTLGGSVRLFIAREPLSASALSTSRVPAPLLHSALPPSCLSPPLLPFPSPSSSLPDT